MCGQSLHGGDGQLLASSPLLEKLTPTRCPPGITPVIRVAPSRWLWCCYPGTGHRTLASLQICKGAFPFNPVFPSPGPALWANLQFQVGKERKPERKHPSPPPHLVCLGLS